MSARTTAQIGSASATRPARIRISARRHRGSGLHIKARVDGGVGCGKCVVPPAQGLVLRRQLEVQVGRVQRIGDPWVGVAGPQRAFQRRGIPRRIPRPRSARRVQLPIQPIHQSPSWVRILSHRYDAHQSCRRRCLENPCAGLRARSRWRRGRGQATRGDARRTSGGKGISSLFMAVPAPVQSRRPPRVASKRPALGSPPPTWTGVISPARWPRRCASWSSVAIGLGRPWWSRPRGAGGVQWPVAS